MTQLVIDLGLVNNHGGGHVIHDEDQVVNNSDGYEIDRRAYKPSGESLDEFVNRRIRETKDESEQPLTAPDFEWQVDDSSGKKKPTANNREVTVNAREPVERWRGAERPLQAPVLDFSNSDSELTNNQEPASVWDGYGQEPLVAPVLKF